MPICESYVSVMRALGHHTLLDNSTQKSTLAGASTDMGMFFDLLILRTASLRHQC